MKKDLKLKKGFYVEEWGNEIKEVYYFKINYLYYSSIENHTVIITNEECMLPPISKYSKNKVFNDFREAQEYLNLTKADKLKYYENSIKEYNKKIKELKDEL